ncbi:MAG: peptidase domain-containing ABC transporter [Gemmatimonas sp.]
MTPTRKDTTKPSAFSRLSRLLAGERREIVIIIFYAALAGVFALTLPVSVGAIVGLIQGGLRLQPVLILIAYVVIGTLASGGLQVLQLAAVERIQQRVFTRMALEFSFRLPRIQYRLATNADMPEAMNRMFEAVTIQKSLAKVLLDSVQAALSVLAGLVVLTIYHPYFVIFGAVLLAVLAGVIALTGRRGLETSLKESTYKYQAVHWLEEQARTFHAFKFSARSGLGMRRMDDILMRYIDSRKAHFRILARQAASVVALRALTVGVFLILGTRLVLDRQITLGQFVAAELVIVTVMLGVEKLMLTVSSVFDLLTSAEKASHIKEFEVDPSGALLLPNTLEGLRVELRGATYRYPHSSHYALRGVDFVVESGERVGINGYEGSGSTTLLRLLGGLLPNAEGVVLMDGTPIAALDISALHEQVGQFLATDELFEGTIEENITVGRAHIDRDMVMRAVQAAGLERDVESLPQGIVTPLGSKLQRLPNKVAIKVLFARAIVGNPRLLIIDDLFRNLSGEDRSRLTEVLVDPERTWTVVVVSREAAVLNSMDRVVTLANGEVIRETRDIAFPNSVDITPSWMDEHNVGESR